MTNTLTNFMNIYSRKEWAILTPVFILFVAMQVTVLTPTLRKQAEQTLRPESRQILSAITADLLNNGSQIKIVKVRTNEGLYVEVYDTPDSQGHTALIEKIELKSNRDAFFKFHGTMTRLALQDIDGDSRPEILVPVLDSDMVAQIHVFRLTADTHKIEVVSN